MRQSRFGLHFILAQTRPTSKCRLAQTLGLTGDRVARHTSNTESSSLSDLRVSKRIAPGRDGAKRFALRYGDQLVCVRHRIDPTGDTRYTTVELLVETTPVVRAGDRLVALRLRQVRSQTDHCSWPAVACGTVQQSTGLSPERSRRTWACLIEWSLLPGKPDNPHIDGSGRQ